MNNPRRTAKITVQEIDDPQRRAALPAGWTGVTWHWPDRDFTECREHIEVDSEPQGSGVPADLVGTLRFDDIECGRIHPILTGEERAARVRDGYLRDMANLASTLRLAEEELRLYAARALEAGATQQEIDALIPPAIRLRDDSDLVNSGLRHGSATGGLASSNDAVTRLRRRLNHRQPPEPDPDLGVSL